MAHLNVAASLHAFLPRDASSEARRLWLISTACALILAAAALIHGIPAAIDAYSAQKGGTGDLRYLIAAGHIVRSDEASRLYGPQPADKPAWVQSHGWDFADDYPYAPAAAYLTVPLSYTSKDSAVDIWRVGVFIASALMALAVAWSFRAWVWRFAVFAAVLFWEPLLLNARIGQTGAFIAAWTMLAVLVFLHPRLRVGGAVLLGLLAIKPTAALGPALAVFPQRTRVWVSFLTTAIVVVLLPFLWLGLDAFRNWLDILSTRGSVDLTGVHVYNQGLTSLLGRTDVVGLLLFLMLATCVLISERINDRLGLYGSAAFAIFAGLLLNPHALLYDWGTAFVGVMLLRRANFLRDELADLAFGLLAASLFLLGDAAWILRTDNFAVRPLTAWSLVVTLGLLYVAWRPPSVLHVQAPAEEG